MAATMGCKEVLPCKTSKAVVHSALRWHPNCKAATFRAERLELKRHSQSAHGIVRMAAAVEAPMAPKDEQAPKHQASATNPLRREDAILFQGIFLTCFELESAPGIWVSKSKSSSLP